ncbi:MAG: hypothetical protein J5764_03760, partial [Bacteroidales bacterium]|nr:hypothetical protein [Bacteroidales bacterium]
RLTAMNNGVLAFAGDLDEAAFKQFLKRYLGNLKRSHRRQVRPSMTVPMRSGTLVYIVDGAPGEESVNMSIYARMNFNREYYMTCRLAMMAMEKELIRAMAPSGMYVQFGYSLETLPEERICINISCRPCRPSGLPEGVRSMSALDAVGPVREVLRRLPSSTINKKDLNAYKAALVNEVEASLSNPASLLEPVMSRYSMGKDFTTGYKGIIGSIDSEAVQTVFEALRNGCRIEYTIL